MLVATTVIEVGVDVANASLMIVEHADRFGLAQLHQLRGRVGRGEEHSICLLLRGNALSETARARLTLMRETNDGFRIAEEDLRLRGAGEILGTRQSGEAQFRLASPEQIADAGADGDGRRPPAGRPRRRAGRRARAGGAGAALSDGARRGGGIVARAVMARMAAARPISTGSGDSAYLEAHAAECRTIDCVPDYGPWVGLVLPAVTLLALLLFLATRLSARVRDLAARITHRLWLQAALLAVALTLFVGLAQSPVLYWLERVVEMPPELYPPDVARVFDDHGNLTLWFKDWLAERLYDLGWTALVLAVALPVALALIRRMPRRYWMIPALGASVWLIWGLMTTNPYQDIVPLPSGPLRADIEAMAQAAGQSPDRIHMGRQDLLSGFVNARVMWWRGKPQVVIGERLFNVLPLPTSHFNPPYKPIPAAEVRAVAGHELAHLRLMHLYTLPAVFVALLWLLAWLAAAGARILVARFGPSWRLAGLADPAALPAIALIFGLAWCVSFFARNALELAGEIQADAAGLDIARDPDGVAALALREARGGPISYPVIEQWLFHEHPSPEDRIRRAMAWKARHRPAAWRATGLSGPITVRFGHGFPAREPEKVWALP